MSLRLLIALTLVGLAAASCPDDCSGHGACARNDKCSCYSNWEGINCALRTCPFGISWVANMRSYLECANRGACDRKTGECQCDDGYTGAGCRRTTCPNDCSGHGTCETIAELASDGSDAAGGNIQNSYGAWDGDKTRGCKCDRGYEGVDCSERMCPKGDDPLTMEVDIFQTTSTSLQVNEVQNITVQKVTAPINGGEVTFTYNDMYNGVWTTRPVELPLVQTWSNKNGHMKVNQFNWVSSGKTVATVSTTTVSNGDGTYHYQHTLSAAMAAATAYIARKGDKLLFSDTSSGAGSNWCLVTVYEDCTATTALKVVADPIQGPCRLTAVGTSIAMYTAWTALGTQAEAASVLASYAATTGTITLATQTASSVTSTEKSLTSMIVPGTWIRIYNHAAIGAYCDFQVNAFTGASTTEIKVNIASATSTYEDASTGIGNPAGSTFCSTFTTAGRAAIIQSHSVLDGSIAEFPVVASGNKYTVALTAATGTAVAYATISRFLNDGSTASIWTPSESLSAGAVVAYMDTTATLSYKCVGKIKSVGTSTLVLVDSGPIGGAASTTFTQCAATAVDTAAIGHLLVLTANAVVYKPSIDDTDVNPNYFNGLVAGDFVTMPLLGGATDGSPTFRIERIDDTTAIGSQAIYFSSGSAPNGGGMYDVMPYHHVLTGLDTEFQYNTDGGVSLPAGSIIQSSWTAGSATGSAYTNSARDVERVLEELPNHVVDDVTVSMTTANLQGYAYSVSFVGTRDTGNQNEIQVNSKGCSLDGCQPRYSGVRVQQSFSIGGAPTNQIASGDVNAVAAANVGVLSKTSSTVYVLSSVSPIYRGMCIFQPSSGESRRITASLQGAGGAETAYTPGTETISLAKSTVTIASAFTADFAALDAYVVQSCGGATLTTSGYTSKVEVGKVLAQYSVNAGATSTTRYVVDVGGPVVKVGDKICVGTQTVCRTVTAATQFQPSVFATLGTDADPMPGNTFNQASSNAKGLILTSGGAVIVNQGGATVPTDVKPYYMITSGTVTGTDVVTFHQGSAAAANSGTAAGSAVSPLILENFADVTIDSAFATPAAHGDVLYVQYADAGRLTTGGGDKLVIYQSGANNGNAFGTLEGTATQTDDTVVFSTATATATDAGPVGILALKSLGDYSSTDKTTYFKSVTTEITRGTTEATECSGRGSCDSESGICECFKGYTGQACQTQTVLL